MSSPLRFVGALFILLGLLLLKTATVGACSCAPFDFKKQFDDAQYVETIYIYGECKVSRRGEFAGFVENPGGRLPLDEDRYFLGYRKKSYKGCSGPNDDYIILASPGDSGMCGVTFYESPGWYLLSFYDDHRNPEESHKQVASCNIIKPWEEFSYEDYSYAESNQQGC